MRLSFPMQSSLCALVALSTMLAACGQRAEEDGERTTVTSRELDVGGIVRMREDQRVVESVREAEEDEISNKAERPQSGLLTAGDYDDVLNPELYAHYASAFAQQDGSLPFVDTRSRVALRVVDAAGRAVPQARIAVERSGRTLHLVSGADGIAAFYPGFDQVEGQARISVASDAGSVSRAVQVRAKGEQAITLTVAGQARTVDALDLMLVLDTTGSMGDEMTYLQAELASILSRVKREADNVDVRIGLVVYRDRGDAYVTRSFP